MFSWLTSLFNWLVELWGKVPDSTKEKIIVLIVETFEAMFREFYRSKQKDQEEKNA